MLHPPKTALSLKLARGKKRSKMHSPLSAHSFALPCKHHSGRTWGMNPHGKFQAHRADGDTGWAFQEMKTRKNIYTQTNPSLSLELIPLLQGNAGNRGPYADLREGQSQCVLCVFIHIYSTCI